VHTTTHGSRQMATGRDVFVDEVATDEVRESGVPQAARLIALAAGAIVTIIGLLAVLKVDWAEAQADSPLYDVAGMTFTPVVAGVTAVLGLILIAVAASRGGEGKFAMGAIVASLGAAMLLVGDLGTRWQTSDGQAWLALAVGGVFIVAGILSERREVVRHTQHAVASDDIV
jgi:hypothetical protein